MPTYHHPGVYVEEINTPPTISAVETAIPGFIGYTQKAKKEKAGDLLLTPVRITSMKEYETYFGLPYAETSLQVFIEPAVGRRNQARAALTKPSRYVLYYSLHLYFANGGGPCYVVSVGTYSVKQIISFAALKTGLDALADVDDVTLLLAPDAINLPSATEYYSLHQAALQQASRLRDRFVVIDVWTNPNDAGFHPVQALRQFNFGAPEILRFGAAYYPRIRTNLAYYYAADGKKVAIISNTDRRLNGTLQELKSKNQVFYQEAVNALTTLTMVLPASSAVVGRYAFIDSTRGVWKAPANVNIERAIAPEVLLTSQQQEDLNVDAATGKSLNAIRRLEGRGAAVIWGARTLAGNDNEWRYVSVRRFFLMVEKSIAKTVVAFCFEPNDSRLWTRVRQVAENFFTGLWRSGALQGTKPEQAFYVRVGLGQTMTAVDIQQGKMIIEWGLAVVRPAEFIVQRLVVNMAVDG